MIQFTISVLIFLYAILLIFTIIKGMRLLKTMRKDKLKSSLYLLLLSVLLLIGLLEYPPVREWAFHARCERYYLQAIRDGDPGIEYCREQVELHRKLKHRYEKLILSLGSSGGAE